MEHPPQPKGLTLCMPALYRIRVQGYLDEKMGDRLGGMLISTHRMENQAPVATLTGRLRDQAELVGVLNSLYELHLPVLAVQLLSSETEASDNEKEVKNGERT